MVLYFCKESQNYFNSFATLVPIGALRWYRFMRYDGTVSPILSFFLLMIFIMYGKYAPEDMPYRGI